MVKVKSFHKVSRPSKSRTWVQIPAGARLPNSDTSLINQPKTRDTVGYEITDEGLRALKLAYKFEQELSSTFYK